MTRDAVPKVFGWFLNQQTLAERADFVERDVIAGPLAIGHQDGLLRMKAMSEPVEVVEKSSAGPIRRRFAGYDPERGVYVCEYTNLTTGETVEGAGYIYTGPLIRALLAPAFDRECSVRLDALRFLDVFARR
jgi:hypothetical protein